MIGYRNARFFAFGWAGAKLDDFANFLPARISGGLIILASMGTSGGVHSACKAMLADASKHASPNAGWPEAAIAGGLGIWLAGPRQYGNRTVTAEKLYAVGRDAKISDIYAALRIIKKAQITLAIFLLLGGWPAILHFATIFLA